jgi:hypothetical protein
MFEGKARKMAADIAERASTPDATITAEVEVHAHRPESTAPGAGPVTFTWYEIRISDGKRVAGLEVDEARALLDDMGQGGGAWGPDRLFAAIESLGVPVEREG